MTSILKQKRTLLASALAFALTVPVAHAQDEGSDSDDASTTLDTVTVTGSRIKRAEIEGPSPVTVITRQDIEREGFQTVADMLQTITQNTTGSFTGDLAVTGFTPNAQVVNLRNLGPGYTLTLVNGRRPAQYPQPYNRDNNVVNVRTIPSSIVERVEILTGGASAIYGSDAVAGVVNIVTRKDYEGDLIKGTIGTTTEGGGDTFTFEYTGGRSGERWSTIWALQYGEAEPIFGTQRDFMADTRNGPLGPNFTNPALSLALLRFNAATGQPTTAPYYPGEDVCDRFGYTTRTTATRGTYCGGFTQSGSRSISNKDRGIGAYNYSTFDLSDTTQLFTHINVYDSEAASSSGTEFWGTAGNQFLQSATGARVNGYYDPQFGELVWLQRVFNPFELGGNEAATTLYDELSYDVMVGMTGTLADRFDWEASAAYAKYDYEADRPRLLSLAMHQHFLGERLGWYTHTNGVQYPIYQTNLDRWTTPFTPEQYAAVSTRAVNTAESSSATVNFNISGDLFEMPAGPAGFAAVLEAGRQTTDLDSDPRTSVIRPLDDQTIFNLTSSGRTKGERNRYALGTEFRFPLLESLTLNAAGRYDKYDDRTAVDDAVTSMAGLEWRPFERLLFRASYATSFRAPDMQQVFAEGSASFSGALDQYACRAGVGVADGLGPRTIAACNVSGDPTIYTIQTAIAGNDLLEEEKGTSMGGGFVWDIVDNMSMSVDYYKIELEDQALQLSAATLLADEANCRLGTYPNGTPYENSSDSAYCQNVYNLVQRQGGTTTGSISRINSAYINAALTETSGVDATYKYTLDTDSAGTFRVDLGYSIVLTDKYKQFEDDELIDYRDTPSLYTQRSRARGSITWAYGDWTTTVFGTRYGSSSSAAGAAGTNAAGGTYGERLAPLMLYNLSVGKQFGPDIFAQFSVINVLNNQYREDNSAGYPFFNNFNGSDPFGRRLYASLAYRF